jgi:hypothetical protein
MITTPKKRMTTLVLWAIAWALALIASAILFKGNPLKDWIQAALFIGAMTLWLWQSQLLARHRC